MTEAPATTRRWSRLSAGVLRWPRLAAPGPVVHRATDIGVVVAVLAVVVLTIATASEAAARSRGPLAFVLGGAMALPLLARRRHPLAVLYVIGAALFAYYAIGYPGFVPAVVLAVPLYTCADAGIFWRSLPVPVAFFATGISLELAKEGRPVLETIDVFLPFVALVAVAMLLGALVRSRRLYAAEVQQRLDRAAVEREREARAGVTRERLRIARELHDTVAHAVSTIALQSGTALLAAGDEPGPVRTSLLAIRETSTTALTEMRQTLTVLRTDADPDEDRLLGGGLGRLPELITAVEAAGLDLDTDVPARLGPDALAPEADHAAYRIVQEALTNVLRHAGPSARAVLRLRLVDGALDIEVRDDGVGPSEATRGDPGAGHGIRGIRERAAAVGGRASAGPLEEGGFVVRARIPVGPGDAS